VSTSLLVSTGAVSCWIVILLRWWTLSGSQMANCWSFTIAATNIAQNNRFHTLVGIAWHLQHGARQCTSTQRLCDGWVSSLQDTRFHAPMSLSADTINIFFYQRTRLSSPSKQGIATGSTSWNLQVCTVLTTHYDVIVTSRLAKNI